MDFIDISTVYVDFFGEAGRGKYGFYRYIYGVR